MNSKKGIKKGQRANASRGIVKTGEAFTTPILADNQQFCNPLPIFQVCEKNSTGILLQQAQERMDRAEQAGDDPAWVDHFTIWVNLLPLAEAERGKR